MKILWLDDLRNPYIDLEGLVPKEKGIVEWVLNYEQFVQWIEKYGLPDIISFDHDLSDNQYTPRENCKDYHQISDEPHNIQNYQEKTGMDCAKWLVDYCLDNDVKLPEFYVHSANPVGAENIKCLLDNYVKHCS
ncbi:cyclic-phosphate processing receiver domain-containing protein [Yeosuana sp.]|uniref:cyclic-phosphate processing receiver domain-containing protein n=1 Tax=Yeosuana sp. TaxID=2529388 RepID=UPI00405526CE